MSVSKAQAAIIDLESIKPLKELKLEDPEEFDKSTQLIQKIPYNDQLLEFQIRLPKLWEEIETNLVSNVFDMDGEVPNDIFGTIAEYVSPAENHLRSRVVIEALELPHEISARHWFISYVLKNGLTIEQIGLEEEGEIEALYIAVEGDNSFVVRAKIIINGARIILAKYILPVELYESGHILQAQVLNTFELLNRSKQNTEKLNTHAFLDQSYFDYPESWVLDAPRVRSINRMSAMLLNYNQAEILKGQINIFLTNKSLGTSRSEELKFYRDKFQIQNYQAGKLIESPSIEFNDKMTFGAAQVYEMNSTQSNLVDYELWLSVIENEDYYYFVSLLTPSRDEDFYNWARNQATYKLVVRNIRRTDDEIDPYNLLN